MRQVARDYSNGKIYKVECNITGLIYVGSTTEIKLSTRLSKHKCHYQEWLDGKRGFTTSFEIIKNNDYQIVLIEDYPCNSDKELEDREKHYIRSLKCVNKLGKLTTTWNERNPERTKEIKAQWYEANKQRTAPILSERGKERVVCECGMEVCRKGLKSHQKRSEHKNRMNPLSPEETEELMKQRQEQYKAKKQEWYQQNKEKVFEAHSEKVVCECGAESTRANLPRHKRTKKHLAYISGTTLSTSS